jgi:hypothetical protein
MDLDTFQAIVEGYQARLVDQNIVGLQTGFFAGYYNRQKKPKPVKHFVKMLTRKHTGHSSVEPDVEYMQSMEEKFRRYGVKSSG